MRARSIRTLAVLASVGLLVGAFGAGPADAKKKKKKKKAPSCAPVTAGGNGAEAELVRLTTAATAEKPVEIELETAQGLGFSSTAPDGGGDEGATSHVYQNLQVISAVPGTALNARVEFGQHQDYDFFLRDAASQESLAYSAGFNGPAPVDSGDGGHAEWGAEAIDAFAYEKCTGYTLDVVSAVTEGGPVALKIWLE